jgi:hypothetical protein
MAYARYGRDSKYYVFWHESKEQAARPDKTKATETLAIWHQDHRSKKEGTFFTYEQVVRMLETADFSAIAGYQSSDRDFLQPLLREFVSDVDAEYQRNS